MSSSRVELGILNILMKKAALKDIEKNEWVRCYDGI